MGSSSSQKPGSPAPQKNGLASLGWCVALFIALFWVESAKQSRESDAANTPRLTRTNNALGASNLYDPMFAQPPARSDIGKMLATLPQPSAARALPAAAPARSTGTATQARTDAETVARVRSLIGSRLGSGETAKAEKSVPASNEQRNSPEMPARAINSGSVNDYLWNSSYQSVRDQYARDSSLPRSSRDIAALSGSELTNLYLWNSSYQSVRDQYARDPSLPRSLRDLAGLSSSELTNLYLWNSNYQSVRDQYARDSSLPRPSRDIAALSGSELTNLYLSNSSRTSGSAWTPGVAENGSYYGEPNVTGVPKTVHVNTYFRKDGTYVRSHYRSPPGSNPPRMPRLRFK